MSSRTWQPPPPITSFPLLGWPVRLRLLRLYPNLQKYHANPPKIKPKKKNKTGDGSLLSRLFFPFLFPRPHSAPGGCGMFRSMRERAASGVMGKSRP